MSKNSADSLRHALELRRKAEEVAAGQEPSRTPVSSEQLAALSHELEVHQIELEMQNAELRETQAAIEHSRDRYADLYDFAPVGYVTLDDEGVVREANLTAAALVGIERGVLLGRPLVSFVDRAGRSELVRYLQRCRDAADGDEVVGDVCLRSKSGGEVPVEFRTAVCGDPAGSAGRYRMAIVDISETTRARQALRELNDTLEQLVAERTSALQMLHDVASMANRSQDVEAAIAYCLRRVVECGKWTFGHALFPADDNADTLFAAYVWYAPDVHQFDEFRDLTLGMSLRRGEDLTGRVFDSREPEWSLDLRAALDPARAEAAAKLGIATAAAVPVMVDKRLVGVLEFFSQQRLEPSDAERDAMLGIGTQLGRVIERKIFQDRLLTLAEEEHRRIGRELHDDVGQELTGLALKMETLAEQPGIGENAARALVRKMVDALDRTRRKCRALSRGLMPAEISPSELAPALQDIAVRTSESHGIACIFQRDGEHLAFDNATATQLYRIAREAVANTVNHAHAQNIDVTLTTHADEAILTVCDDGVGMPPEHERGSGMGIQIMRYRAGLIAGRFEIESPPNGGAAVRCRVPARTIDARAAGGARDARHNGQFARE